MIYYRIISTNDGEEYNDEIFTSIKLNFKIGDTLDEDKFFPKRKITKIIVQRVN